MADISKIKMPDNQSYDLKDAEARQSIDNIPFIKGSGNSSAALKGTLGNFTNSAEGQFSVAEGVGTTANGTGAHAEGLITYAGSTSTHAEGGYTAALGSSSHAEGQFTLAIGSNSHAEGTGQGSNGYKITGEKNATTYTLSITPTQSLINAMIVYKKNYATITAIDTTNNTITLSNSLGNAIENEQCMIYFGYAIGMGTHTEGFGTIANALGMHAMGAFNIPATLYDNWTAGTAYSVGDRVTKTDAGFICLEANSDETWTSSKWGRIYSNGDSIFTIGNGTGHTQRSNALAVDINGNAKFNGNIYVGCNADSTGGIRIPHDIQIDGVSIVNNGVANIPVASSGVYGTVKINPLYGIGIYNGELLINGASESDIKTGTQSTKAISSYRQHQSIFYGLSKLAGVDLKNEEVTVGTYPEASKTAIRSLIGAVSSSDVSSQITTAIGNINSFNIEVVQALPTENIKNHTIYFVPKTGETNDVYDEYIYINNAWEMIGNTQIDLSNYVQKTDYATSSVAGVVKVDPSANSGIQITNSGLIATVNANANQIKEGIQYNTVIPPARQHISVFYGLAKAAGDTTQSQSNNAVGTYTSEAKTAIQQMLDVPSTNDIPDVSIYATKTDTILDTTLSLGRKENTVIGNHSVALGSNLIASGPRAIAFGTGNMALEENTIAEGTETIALNTNAHTEGQFTVATGICAHAEGGGLTLSNNLLLTGAANATQYTYSNIKDSNIHIGDIVIYNSHYGIINAIDTVNKTITLSSSLIDELNETTCYLRGSYAKGNYSHTEGLASIAGSKYQHIEGKYNIPDFSETYATIVGNGSYSARANAYTLDWQGNGRYKGNIYIGTNADSTGGSKVLCEADFATDTDIQNIINGGAGA